MSAHIYVSEVRRDFVYAVADSDTTLHLAYFQGSLHHDTKEYLNDKKTLFINQFYLYNK